MTRAAAEYVRPQHRGDQCPEPAGRLPDDSAVIAGGHRAVAIDVYAATTRRSDRRPVLEIVRAEEPTPIASHSIRSYLFARLLARHEGLVVGRDVGEQALFAACVLHDIGLAARGNGTQRFEVDGADTAVAILAPLGVPDGDCSLIWEAIALHTSPGIAERRGPLAYLTRGGVGADFGRGSAIVTDDEAAVIHDAYPRQEMTTSLVDAIVAQARTNPAKAPRYTIAGELLRERAAGPATEIEKAAAAARWGN